MHKSLSYFNESLKINNSNISGLGVFTSKKIERGETICFMEGEQISLKELAYRELKGLIHEGDALQIADEQYIIMKKIYCCINHSCNPNTFIRGKNELVALRDIEIGEEITYDYSTTMWEDTEKIKGMFNEELWTMTCLCKAENCRKEIKQFYELPRLVLKKYQLIGLPDLIADKLKKPHNLLVEKQLPQSLLHIFPILILHLL